MAYTKTTWVDDVTPVSAQKMNNLETQYEKAKADLDTHKADNTPHEGAVNILRPEVLSAGKRTKTGIVVEGPDSGDYQNPENAEVSSASLDITPETNTFTAGIVTDKDNIYDRDGSTRADAVADINTPTVLMEWDLVAMKTREMFYSIRGSTTSTCFIETSTDGSNWTIKASIEGSVVETGSFSEEFRYIRWRSSPGDGSSIGRKVYLYYLYHNDGTALAIKDNDVNTYWEPEPANEVGAWVYVDLGENKAVEHIQIYFNSDANYRPSSYKIQTAKAGEDLTDTGDWIDRVHETTAPAEGWNEYSLGEVVFCRYIRVKVVTHGASGTRINEIQYATPAIWTHAHINIGGGE